MFLININDLLPVFITFLGGIGFLILVVFLTVLSQKIASKKVINKYENIESEIYRIIYEKVNVTVDELLELFELPKEEVLNVLNNLINNNKIIKVENYYKVIN